MTLNYNSIIMMDYNEGFFSEMKKFNSSAINVQSYFKELCKLRYLSHNWSKCLKSELVWISDNKICLVFKQSLSNIWSSDICPKSQHFCTNFRHKIMCRATKLVMLVFVSEKLKKISLCLDKFGFQTFADYKHLLYYGPDVGL